MFNKRQKNGLYREIKVRCQMMFWPILFVRILVNLRKDEIDSSRQKPWTSYGSIIGEVYELLLVLEVWDV